MVLDESTLEQVDICEYQNVVACGHKAKPANLLAPAHVRIGMFFYLSRTAFPDAQYTAEITLSKPHWHAAQLTY